jgi:hypothetical protein
MEASILNEDGRVDIEKSIKISDLIQDTVVEDFDDLNLENPIVRSFVPYDISADNNSPKVLKHLN